MSDVQLDVSFELKFGSGSSAFQENPHQETARILRHWANRIEAHEEELISTKVFDLNGCSCGSIYFMVEAEDACDDDESEEE